MNSRLWRHLAAEYHAEADPHLPGVQWRVFEGVLEVRRSGDWWFETYTNQFPETPERVVLWVALALEAK